MVLDMANVLRLRRYVQSMPPRVKNQVHGIQTKK